MKAQVLRNNNTRKLSNKGYREHGANIVAWMEQGAQFSRIANKE